MKINKRELLKRLTQENLWKKLFSEEIRLYLLIVIFADEIRYSLIFLLAWLGYCLFIWLASPFMPISIIVALKDIIGR